MKKKAPDQKRLGTKLTTGMISIGTGVTIRSGQQVEKED